MRVGTSNAEIKVLTVLQQMGLIQRMHALGTTIVFLGGEAAFYPKEDVTLRLLSRAQGFTIPDFPFLKDKLPVYLDGPVHKRSGVADRDWRIDKMSRLAGLNPLRLAYTPPISKRHLTMVCETIKKELEQ